MRLAVSLATISRPVPRAACSPDLSAPRNFAVTEPDLPRTRNGDRKARNRPAFRLPVPAPLNAAEAWCRVGGGRSIPPTRAIPPRQRNAASCMRSALTLRKKDRADQTVCSCRGERADHGSRPSPLQLREHGAAPGPPTRAWSRASAGPGGWSPAPRSSCSSPSPRCHRTGNGPQGSRHRVRGRDRAGRDHTSRAACARPDGRVQDLELAAACLGPVGRCRFDAPGDPPRLDGSDLPG